MAAHNLAHFLTHVSHHRWFAPLRFITDGLPPCVSSQMVCHPPRYLLGSGAAPHLAELLQSHSVLRIDKLSEKEKQRARPKEAGWLEDVHIVRSLQLILLVGNRFKAQAFLFVGIGAPGKHLTSYGRHGQHNAQGTTGD